MLPKLIIKLLMAVVYYWVPNFHVYMYRTFINVFLTLFLGKIKMYAIIFYTANIYYPATVRSMVCTE